jgi:hypothetical protein
MMKDFPSEENNERPKIPYVGILNPLLTLSEATNIFCYEEHVYFIVVADGFALKQITSVY